jgi:hypothetical protein
VIASTWCALSLLAIVHFFPGYLGHNDWMRTVGGIAVFIGIVLLVSRAGAEENPTAAVGSEGARALSQAGFADRLFGGRSLGGFVRDLLSRLMDEQRAEFDRIADRYSRLVELTKHFEERDEAEFEARAERYERLRLLTRKLESEQDAREERDFEARVNLVVRELAFTQELERRRAVSTWPTEAPSSSDHWPLYERE